MTYQLPPLPYATDALEPYIDAQTMELHHDLHHGGYVKSLNGALEGHEDLAQKSIEELIRGLHNLPESIQAPVRKFGGGHFNHSIFWTIMGPNCGGEPTGAIKDVITDNFGDFESFKEQFNDAGAKQFGSGFVWLVRTADGKYEITSTPNQENPLSDGHFPIFGNDVWEHAYYLKYQNKRAEYLKEWWNLVNWDAVNQRLEIAQNQ